MTIFKTGRRAVIASVLAGAVCAAMPAWAQEKPAIKLGFIGPLSGGNAQQGLGARNGFLLALEQANAGDYPFTVEPVVLDDASDPQTGVSAALKLVNDPDVAAAIGHWNSPVALATIPVFNRFQMPMIVWGAISPKITEQNLPEITRVTPTLVTENKPLAEWAAGELDAKNIAIIADTSDYGTANADAFEEFFGEAGGSVLSKDLLPVGATDFRAVLTRLRGEAPDAVYFGGVITEAGILRRQMVELGLDVPMIGISGFYDPEFIALAGDAAPGTMVSYPASQSNPKLDQLLADYDARGFAEPTSPYTKYAFDAANILIAAIAETGTDDKQALAEAIRAAKHDGALGLTSFDANGQTEIPVAIQIKEVRDGAWVTRGDS
ncbi:branched-chain amino acid ABC transporter substrate-binding protein [Leisingera daeponensis]|uniref:branched-chain amino acid ABC transporter substrate-binding protein n=1 Tax=Leisingera daeponensis TaxID=405746 RepID=UPI001C966A98|nr:branched-chain amino acid ABC transporter substrate-binding protein [Leisingera daeponensis]MBY6059035.1 branched-chain amino acid ABC transporter substrate-binding protein [Leisingera daeponensis]